MGKNDRHIDKEFNQQAVVLHSVTQVLSRHGVPLRDQAETARVIVNEVSNIPESLGTAQERDAYAAKKISTTVTPFVTEGSSFYPDTVRRAALVDELMSATLLFRGSVEPARAAATAPAQPAVSSLFGNGAELFGNMPPASAWKVEGLDDDPALPPAQPPRGFGR